MTTTAVLAATAAAARSADFTVASGATVAVYLTPESVSADTHTYVAILQRKSTLDASGYQAVYRSEYGIEVTARMGGKHPSGLVIIAPGTYSVLKNATLGAVGVSVDS